jgi:hypothetical protein
MAPEILVPLPAMRLAREACDLVASLPALSLLDAATGG